MNFAPFTGHIPSGAALPTIQQFAAKFGYESSGSAGSVAQEPRYQAQAGGVQFAVAPAAGLPVDAMKFRQGDSVVVMSAPQQGAVTLTGIGTMPAGVKYQTITSSSTVNVGNIAYGAQYVPAEEPLKGERDKRDYRDDLQHDIMATMMQQQVDCSAMSAVTQAPLQQGTQQLLVVLHEPKEAAALARALKQDGRQDRTVTAPAEFISIGDVGDGTWQTLGSGVADYLAALPLPLHHLLKYSTGDKRDDQPTIVATTAPAIATLAQISPNNENSVVVQNTTIAINASVSTHTQGTNTNEAPIITNTLYYSNGRKKKKKKEVTTKKPRPKPGEIRITTALDGSTLYCCPECHMAYPERDLVDQHLVGHTMERKFICDICNAALKRKDHLTRHKQSHNAERPHVCSVCLKAFKRKEQLTLHFIIHSGEKRHVCNECGKGFYRKDHLRKHTRSHIARRVKAELSQETTTPPLSQVAPAPPLEPS
ncbi:fez family zinc finger protein erm-like isoform X1 [Colias croceus]|uniref:fez family zinc finger protein erm-like isoform X1 n=1 Tax=Colias crocea TaxID=72248 RepID=UPI001E27C015|nr:fez family zinc finger protein erm-like isoform X1 [Colias croceus]XP_045497681.1 fez family zinc finger protein erm-like isoform X1 [Colias croceus]